jgi:chorismate dehydratase
MRKLRISAISFLNTAPLMWDFDHGAVPSISGTPRKLPEWLSQNFDVEYTLPSSCAEALRAEKADIGIIPVAAYATIPNLAIIPDVAIAAQGPVRSILLISNTPLEKVRTLAADTSSRTSVALAKVLFHQWFGHAPEFVPVPPRLEIMLAQCDAALIIGDPAFTVDRQRYLTWDLAEEWKRLTAKSFVFAVWAVRLAALRDASPDLKLSTIFQASRDHGLEPASLSAISSQWTTQVGLSGAEVRDYLTRNIYYWLDHEAIVGLELFLRLAVNCGALPSASPLRFLGTLESAISILR